MILEIMIIVKIFTRIYKAETSHHKTRKYPSSILDMILHFTLNLLCVSTEKEMNAIVYAKTAADKNMQVVKD